ncbi:MAG TPA: saccharopine dehydrogenase NADP-binding domain-containing protein [Candidatus Acidoferrales bacterium]|nr:saccharopine dehydrogenase NADP-binding domain-containing protein [Candidatus Acidoferrales bacterium]
MSKVVVLGGCGAVGSVAVRTLAGQAAFSEVVIGDMNVAKAQELATSIGAGKVAAVEVDAADARSVQHAVAGADVVLNCVGPFYKTVKTILGTVISAGIDYVDICDDVDVTLEILGLNAAAKNAGVTAVIGMGASPGVTNLLAKYLADTQLDETDSVDIFHCHGGEPIEGAGVIGHRFHCMSIDIPMFLDGALRSVKYFGSDGIALRQTFNFPVLGEVPLYPYPHPEQVTLPRHLKLRQVTNKGSVLPIAYYELTAELCRLGLSSREPVEVNGRPVAPYDFAVAYLIRERDRLLRATNFGSPRGCMSVVVKGRKDGQPRELRVHISSAAGGLGEGTGIPAAIGALLLSQGKIGPTGVLPPEACIDPAEFLALATQFIGRGGSGGGEILFESVAADGRVTTMKL